MEALLLGGVGKILNAAINEARLHRWIGQCLDGRCLELSNDVFRRAPGREKCVLPAGVLDARLPQARAQLGYVLLFQRQHDAAIGEFERAFALNPNFIDHRYVQVLICAGEPARAIELLESSIHLDPFQPLLFAFGQRGSANYMLMRYGEAVRLFRECALRLPNLQWPHLMLASAYAQSGQLEEARTEAAEVRNSLIAPAKCSGFCTAA
jgi:tetratricopeptide (TPR) repeat protein